MVDDIDNSFEKKLIKEVLFANINEQKKARRINAIFKFFIIAYLVFIPFWYLYSDKILEEDKSKPHAAVVEINGLITPDKQNSANNINDALTEAFKASGSKAVILKINSRGGTPVQANMILSHAQYLKKKYHKTLYAAIEDFGASGGYMVALAADHIYADESSLVGSIGVLISSYGFVDLLSKLGIERRIYAAGKNKAYLDPFSPRDTEQDEFVKSQLELVHASFIEKVKKERGNKLKEDETIFTGYAWVGEKAKELGLIDEFGSANQIARDVLEVETIITYSKEDSLLKSIFEKLLPF